MGSHSAGHDKAFQFFYSCDRSFPKTAEKFGVSERQVRNWGQQEQWHARADALDAEARQQAEREAVERQRQVLQDQARAGELLRRRATEYFVANKIDNAADAIRAAVAGCKLELQALDGVVPDYIVQLMGMTDEQLREQLQDFVGRIGQLEMEE